jgi:hypothetical protein
MIANAASSQSQGYLPQSITTVEPVADVIETTCRVSRTPEIENRIERLLRFREENPDLFESRRIAGMKRSPRVRENLQRLHRERKEEWRASARKNPRLQATEQHIAAKLWQLRAPSGRIYVFRNLKKFVREHEQLFTPEDVTWKNMQGKTSQAWCRAFQLLSRLRPTCAKHIEEWSGWTWA